MKSTFTFLFILAVIFAYSQKFQSATIELATGQQKTGLVNAKSLTEKQIKFKTDENAKEETLPNSALKSIIFMSDDKSYQLDYLTFYTTAKRKQTESNWMLKLVSGYYDLYTVADYSFDKKGNLKLSTNYLAGSTLPEFYYFIKKHDQNTGDFFAVRSPSPTYFGLHKILQENVQRFMADDKNLIAKVESKKYSTRNIEQIVTEYNNTKK